jgi:hypothetical protein
MAIDIFSQIPTMTGDTEWRDFLTEYTAALVAAGFVQTSDTGQLNPATATRPTGTNTVGGYQIWRFDDDAQSTQPIFIKVEYGVPSVVTRLQIWITIGTGSDGAGAITNVRIPRAIVSISGSSAILGDVWVAGGDGYLSSGFWVNSANASSTSWGFLIERLRLASGDVDTSSDGAGIILGHSNGWMASSYDGHWIETAVSTYIWPTLQPSHTTWAYRGITYAHPYYPIVGVPRAPLRGAVAVNPADSGYTLPFTIELYSEDHIFRSVFTGGVVHGRGGNGAPAFRYE